MKLDILKTRIAEAELNARMAIDEIAGELRNRVVIPFCQRRKCRFVSGMGSWGFVSLDPEKEFKYESYSEAAAKSNGPEFFAIYNLLEEPSTIINGCPIGSFMEDYTPPP